ncbi:unnamed protein product [Moneuplotes crassus]|uniref:Uncharacterized protein n=1 Tax=Euplotes crassus TaxID=5936 RepID=A0AAD1X4U7_EUPCR|nr:unnamed protein product [Moneuplotes crassus]
MCSNTFIIIDKFKDSIRRNDNKLIRLIEYKLKELRLEIASTELVTGSPMDLLLANPGTFAFLSRLADPTGSPFSSLKESTLSSDSIILCYSSPPSNLCLREACSYTHVVTFTCRASYCFHLYFSCVFWKLYQLLLCLVCYLEQIYNKFLV